MTGRPCWGSIEQNFFSKNLYENRENRVWFSEEGNAFFFTSIMTAMTSRANQQFINQMVYSNIFIDSLIIDMTFHYSTDHY